MRRPILQLPRPSVSPTVPSVLTTLRLENEKTCSHILWDIVPFKPAHMVILSPPAVWCEVQTSIYMAQLMPLPLTVSRFRKIQIGFTFLVLAHLGSRGQWAVKQLCVCVCAGCSGFWSKLCVVLFPYPETIQGLNPHNFRSSKCQ